MFNNNTNNSNNSRVISNGSSYGVRRNVITIHHGSVVGGDVDNNGKSSYHSNGSSSSSSIHGSFCYHNGGSNHSTNSIVDDEDHCNNNISNNNKVVNGGFVDSGKNNSFESSNKGKNPRLCNMRLFMLGGAGKKNVITTTKLACWCLAVIVGVMMMSIVNNNDFKNNAIAAINGSSGNGRVHQQQMASTANDNNNDHMKVFDRCYNKNNNSNIVNNSTSNKNDDEEKNKFAVRLDRVIQNGGGGGGGTTTTTSTEAGQGAVTKTWVVGYPGSGSEMLRVLIEGLTGMKTDVGHRDSGVSCYEPNIVTCKTHYPVLINGLWTTEQPGTSFHNRYMLLMRNPAKAIPSFFNYKWEYTHDDIEDHSVQAPLNEWRSWRDRQFDKQMKLWVGIIKTWEQGPYAVSLYLPYEDLTDTQRGPPLTAAMAKEFAVANHLSTADDDDDLVLDDVPCLWKSTVLDHPSKMRVSTYTPGFTIQQKTKMLKAVQDLIDWCKERNDTNDIMQLVPVLESYIQSITDNLVIDQN